MDTEDRLSLALRVDARRLLLFLTDGNALICHGWASGDFGHITVDDSACPAVSRGHGIVIPANIAERMAASPYRLLEFSIPAELDDLPLETLPVNGQPLAAHFRLYRRIEGDEPLGQSDRPERMASLPARISLLDQTASDNPFTDESWQQRLLALKIRRLTASRELAEEPTILIAPDTAQAVALGRRLTAPVLVMWPDDNACPQACRTLASHGHSALVFGGISSMDALRENALAVLQGLAQGQTVATVLRKMYQEKDAAAPQQWHRFYGLTDHAVCQAPPTDRAGEVRQVTAMSLDLVGSTALLKDYGSEQYSEILAAVRQVWLRGIREAGGSSFERKGDDSALACFGIPIAHEDAAQRALGAALSIQAALRQVDRQPKVRIGIATGRVAVSDGIPHGSAVHLAARLRARALPGTTMVDWSSRSLCRRQFAFGPTQTFDSLDGLSERVQAAVLSKRLERERVASTKRSLQPLVGRENELAVLLDHWRRARGGALKLVTISGEAGIGKTRLVQALAAHVGQSGGQLLQVNGSSDNRNKPFFSLAESLRRGIGFRSDDSLAQAEDRIRQVLITSREASGALLNVCRLLSLVSSPSTANSLDQPAVQRPETLRDQIFRGLCYFLLEASKANPILLLIEDLQTIDPSSVEALGCVLSFLRQAKHFGLLIVCTYRQGSAIMEFSNSERIELKPLDHESSECLIRQVAGNALTFNATRRLAGRANGVPLFLEESARMMLGVNSNPTDLLQEVPASLEGLLMARLDRLSPGAKTLAQIAAVLGRDHPASLLEKVVSKFRHEQSVLNYSQDLEELLHASVLIQAEHKTSPHFSFWHEMVRDVAYSSMWARDRQRLHASAAECIAQCWPELLEQQPEVLARHLTASEQHLPASVYWERAAREAAAESANAEAITHLQAGIKSLSRLPRDLNADKTELRLQLLLASRLIASEGYGSPEVERVYRRARALATGLADQVALFKTMLGLEGVYVMRGELARAAALALQALHVTSSQARDSGVSPSNVQARWTLANVRFHQGHSSEALALMDQCLRDYDIRSHRAAAVQDPAVMCLCYRAWAQWELGLADTAKRTINEVLHLAEKLDHRFSEAEAYGFAASICLFRGEIDAGLTYANRAIAVCEKFGFTVWLAHARLIQARLRCIKGEGCSALADMRAAHDLWVNTGAVLTRPFYLTLIAESCVLVDMMESAQTCINEALDIVRETSECYHEAEILRVGGLLAAQRGDRQQAYSLWVESLSISGQQGKKAFSLRTAIQMSRHMYQEGKHSEASTLLVDHFSALTEGQSTSDVLLARSLISKWQSNTAQLA